MPKHAVLAELDAGQVRDYRAVLCDLDGCLIAGGRALPGAGTFLRALGERLWIVSNNSSDTAVTLAGRLKALGLEIPPGRVLLAGEQALDHLARTRPRARLRCLTDAPLVARAQACGFELDTDRSDVVLLGRMAAFDLDRLHRAVSDLVGGASLMVANADRTHPDQDGNPVPETGAWLAAVRACLPELAYACYGKPAPHLLTEALRRSGVAAADAIFVGDNPSTDGAAAHALGMDFIEIRRAPPGGAPAVRQAPDALEVATW